MTTHVVTDKVLATYSRREWELRRRLMEGTLDQEKVCVGIQHLIESCSLSKFPVWRTITHNRHRNAESYRTGLSSIKCKFRDSANDLLGCFETASVDEGVYLGCASVADLGFKEATRFDLICDRIEACGGTLCLPEDGPVLREQYPDQLRGECVRLAMKAIRVAGRGMFIFCVEQSEVGLFLSRDYGDPSSLFFPVARFVFRLRKWPLVA